MKYKIYSKNDKYTQKLFLKLPSQIYLKSENFQDYKTEYQILNNMHPLSKDITVYPIVITNLNDVPFCRCLITYYNNDTTAYVGFFEAEQYAIEAVQLLFETVENKVKKDGKNKILGPIDASIYINYRFKISSFNKTYTAEPCNKDYYPQMWTNNGYKLHQRYISNYLRKVTQEDFDPRLEKVYQRYLNRGITFTTPTKNNFKKCLEDVYELLVKTYADFPGYKSLTKDQFLTLYSPLEKILNFDMVCLAYQKNKLCAFCICIPNYKDLTKGKMTPLKFLKILKIKKFPQEYILLYAGAEPSKAGLGSALLHHVRNLLYQNQQTCITALIKEGNLTGRLYDDLYESQTQYILLEKNF